MGADSFEVQLTEVLFDPDPKFQIKFTSFNAGKKIPLAEVERILHDRIVFQIRVEIVCSSEGG